MKMKWEDMPIMINKLDLIPKVLINNKLWEEFYN